jgi:hypothetical protein
VSSVNFFEAQPHFNDKTILPVASTNNINKKVALNEKTRIEGYLKTGSTPCSSTTRSTVSDARPYSGYAA